MRPKFLDIETITGKKFLLLMSIVAVIYWTLSELLKIGWNALNIIHIDFWVAELVIFIIIAITGVVIVEIEYRKDIKNIEGK